MTPRLLDIPHGVLQGRNTTTLATKLMNDLHTQQGFVVLLDVAKAFLSVPQPTPTNIVKEAGARETNIRILGEIYQQTPAILSLQGHVLPIRPTRGMKEGCPLSPTLFLLYYNIVLKGNQGTMSGSQPLRLCRRYRSRSTHNGCTTSYPRYTIRSGVHDGATFQQRQDRSVSLGQKLLAGANHVPAPTVTCAPTHTHIPRPRAGPPHARSNSLGHGDRTSIP